jgi:UDP-N-acetylglucosamine--N-acetylmuramyl-(pentapeptide) pyrophosphoryl-undecaprenol N-acetylglucosamine transferase
LKGDIRVILAGGGTGGHVFPAINIAQYLKKYWGAQCRFIGTRRGIENIKVSQAGFVVKHIWISGFKRSWNLSNLLFPLKLVISLIQSHRELRQFKPNLVIGTGGYVSGPVLYRAIKMKIPTAIQEQNSYPGITTRILASRVDRVFLAYADSLNYLKNVKKYTLVGNPTKNRERSENKEEALRYFGLKKDMPIVLIFGGSQGARNINQVLDKILKGADRMDLAYTIADFAICRAGAMTISELAAAALPAILIPLPHAAEDHQLKNAQTIARGGGAYVIEDKPGMEELLISAINDLLTSPEKIRAMAQKIASFHRPNTVQQIAAELEQLLQEKALADV